VLAGGCIIAAGVHLLQDAGQVFWIIPHIDRPGRLPCQAGARP
jgi:hypothetical protein